MGSTDDNFEHSDDLIGRVDDKPLLLEITGDAVRIRLGHVG